MNFRRWGNIVQPLTPWDKIQPPNYGPSQWGAPPSPPHPPPSTCRSTSQCSALSLQATVLSHCLLAFAGAVPSSWNTVPSPWSCVHLRDDYSSFRPHFRCTAYLGKPFVYPGICVPRCLSFDFLWNLIISPITALYELRYNYQLTCQ